MKIHSDYKEYHVAKTGTNSNISTDSKPLLTIQAAAMLARPGDTITVHEGVYRERIDPPMGGDSDEQRIVYQAAQGENVAIKGSEVIKDWVHLECGLRNLQVGKLRFGLILVKWTPIKSLLKSINDKQFSILQNLGLITLLYVVLLLLKQQLHGLLRILNRSV